MALFPTESAVTCTSAKDSARTDGAAKRMAAVINANLSVCFDMYITFLPLGLCLYQTLQLYFDTVEFFQQ